MTRLKTCAILLAGLLSTSTLLHTQDQRYESIGELGSLDDITISTSIVEVILVFEPNNPRRDLLELLQAFPQLLPPEPGDYLRSDAVKLALRPDLRGNQQALDDLMQELRQAITLRGVNPVYVAESGKPLYLDNTIRCQLADGVSPEEILDIAAEAGFPLQHSHTENIVTDTEIFLVPRAFDVVEVARSLDLNQRTNFARPVLIDRSQFEAAPGLIVGTAPNPCTQNALITYSVEYGGPISLTVHRMDGTRMLQVVDSPDHPRGMSRHEIDVSLWPIGTYLVHLETPYDGRTSKFVVTR